MKLGEPLAERKKLINELLKQSRSQYSLIHKFKTYELDVIEVPIDLLKYRVENGREFWDIKEYETQNQLEEGYFLDNKEDNIVQEQMHRWLYKRAIEGEEDLRKEYGKEGAKQTQEIIINNRTDGFVGFVVDGNRRLALWRDMYEEDPNKNSSFKHVKCAVLPPHFDSEMEEDIEMDLQIKKTLKAEYDWPNDRQLKERALSKYPNRRKGVKNVSKEFNIKEGRLKQELAGYDLAKEYIEKTGVYMSSLLDDMQAFLTLGVAYSKKGRTALQKKELKELGFNIISQKNPKPRKHAQIQSLDQNLNEVVVKINQDTSVPDKKPEKGRKGKLKPKRRKADEGPPSNITDRPIGELEDVTREAIREINREKEQIVSSGKPLQDIKRIKSALKTFLKSLEAKVEKKKEIKVQVKEVDKVLELIETKLNTKSK